MTRRRSLDRPRPRRARHLGFTAGCLSALGVVAFEAAPARAQTSPELFVDIAYRVDPTLESCPSEAEFRGLVAQQLGYDPHRPGSPLSIEVLVRPIDGGMDGAIHWREATARDVGQRRVAAPDQDCRELVATMAFVVTVQIQLMAIQPATAPDADATEPVRDLPPVRPGADDGAADAATPEERATPRARPGLDAPPWSLAMGAGPSLGLGLAPRAVAGGHAFLSLAYGRIGLELGGEGNLPVSARSAAGDGFRIRTELGTLAACGRSSWVSACAITKLGRVRVDGLGVDRPVSASGLLAQLGARVLASTRLGSHLTVQVHGDVLHLLSPWTVELNQVPRWTMPRWGGGAGLALAARIP